MVDWIEFAMQLIAIMGIPYTQREGGMCAGYPDRQLKGRAFMRRGNILVSC